MSLNISAILVLGRLNVNSLAAMALTTLYANVTGFSVIMGMASAIDTLCSQAYGEYLVGNAPRAELGRHLSRVIFTILLATLPISIIWIFTEPLLLLAGQDPEISRLSAKFTKLMIPSLIPYVFSESLKRFMLAQGIMKPPMVVIMIISPLNFILQYTLGK
jgi:MATE family multidrug resistance protein